MFFKAYRLDILDQFLNRKLNTFKRRKKWFQFFFGLTNFVVVRASKIRNNIGFYY